MDPALDLALRTALSLLLGASATHKIRDQRSFRATLAEYRLLPTRLVAAGAVLVAAVELGLAIGLLVRPRPSLAGAAALLALYGAAIAINLRAAAATSTAAAAAGRPISGWLVGRNAALATIALAGLLAQCPRTLTWLDAVTIAAATAFAAAIYTSLDRMIADAPALARVRGTA
jgi:hypothetical protein